MRAAYCTAMVMLGVSGWSLTAPAKAQTLTVTATGMIAKSCGLTASGQFGNANLDANGTVTAAAVVNCNLKYVVKATSARGGLKNATAAPSSSFSNLLAYNFSLSVPLDNGGGTISATCTSTALVAGASNCQLSPAGTGLSSGNGTSVNQNAALSIGWTLPTTTRLVAGSYSDVLTITIAAQQ